MVSVNQVDGLTLLACGRVTGGKVGLTDAKVWRQTAAPPRPGVPEMPTSCRVSATPRLRPRRLAKHSGGRARWWPGRHGACGAIDVAEDAAESGSEIPGQVGSREQRTIPHYPVGERCASGS